MNKVKPLVAGISLAVLLSACGGGGSDSTSTPVAVTPPPPAAINISGTAVKGIIKNGIVNVYGVTDGVQDTVALVTGVTDDTGNYSLEIPGDYTGPVVVEITAGPSTLMTCDVAAGCDGVAFGSDVTLADGDIELKAVVPTVSAGETLSTNVSTLTSLAAQRTIDQGISETSAQEANSQVANLFGITGDLNELEVVDITDPAALESASADVQQAALVSAAILSEGLEAGNNIRESIDSVVDSFSENNGQIVSRETAESSSVTLEEIFNNVKTIVESEAFDSVDLGTLKTKTDVLIATAEASTADELTVVEPTTPEQSTAIATARTLVNNIRRVGISTTFDETGEPSLFLESVGDSMELMSEDTSLVMEATAHVLGVIAEAMLEAEDGATVYSSEDADFEVTIAGDVYSASTDIEVYDDVVDANGGISEELQGTVAVDMSITGSLSFLEEENPVEGTAEEGTIITFDETWEENIASNITSFEGTAETDGVRLTINSASQILITLDSEGDYSEEDAASDNDLSFNERDDIINTLSVLDVILDVQLEQLTTENSETTVSPVTFDGELSFMSDGDVTITELTERGFDQSECGPATSDEFADLVAGIKTRNPDFPEENFNICITRKSLDDSITFSELSLGLNGTFTQAGNSFDAILSADLSLPEGVSIDSHRGTAQVFLRNTVNSDFNSNFFLFNDTDSEENEEEFIGLDLALSLNFGMPGVDPSTQLEFTGSRTGLKSADVTIVLVFDGVRLSTEIVVEGENREIRVTDQNSNVLTLTEDATEQGESILSGNVMVGDDVVATISEESNGVIVRYTDGTFESAM